MALIVVVVVVVAKQRTKGRRSIGLGWHFFSLAFAFSSGEANMITSRDNQKLTFSLHEMTTRESEVIYYIQFESFVSPTKRAYNLLW